MNNNKETPKWRRAQNSRIRREKKAQVYLGIGFIALVLGLILVNSLYQRAKSSVWDGESRLSTVEQFDNNLMVQSIIPSQNRQIRLEVPGEVLVKAPFGFGEYQLGKVFELGELENQGERVLIRSTQNLLGIEITGFKVGNQTNLSWWDKLRVSWFLNFNLKSTLKLDLVERAVLSQEQLADGSDVFRPSLILLDELINEYYFDEKVINEAYEVAVINASEVTKIANQVARILSNLGVEVIKTDNQELEDSSVIKVKNKQMAETKTIKLLQRLLDIDEVKIDDLKDDRAEVVVIIGKDYVTKSDPMKLLQSL